ncbi:hypothetical protein PV327_010073 [Microctonus hyperodae]|uniref:Uncharacterized protein n=1 Tax=Microctonus hyperodae TaxID=165561 RepID=A0AA39KGF0_MICHY|nr:hypothetical protein PV327_010073 [Microctonus hyperodae]
MKTLFLIVQKKTYKHGTIGDGFTDPKLHGDLQCLFQLLASKAEEFAAGVSTNLNENMNGIIASYAPKSRLYGMSASGAYRNGLAINSKNTGTEYTMVNMNTAITLSPGSNTKKYASKIDILRKRKNERSSTIEVKKRRLHNKKEKAQLKHKRELSEGIMYETNCALMNRINIPAEITPVDDSSEPVVILFDIETGGFHINDEILQIAAKSKGAIMSFLCISYPRSL